MKTIKIVAATVMFALSQAASPQENAEDWLSRQSYADAVKKEEMLSSDLYFEVVASKVPSVINHHLKNIVAVALDESGARSLTGPYFRCPENLRPFLLRALYINGGYGFFEVSQHGKSVRVFHGSMGGFTGYKKSALVACLHDLPDVVYTTAATAL